MSVDNAEGIDFVVSSPGKGLLLSPLGLKRSAQLESVRQTTYQALDDAIGGWAAVPGRWLAALTQSPSAAS